MDLVLRVPRQSEEAEFLRAHRATSLSGPTFLHYVGSITTIEKNGGVLESLVIGPDGATPKRRYWIATVD